MVPEGYIDITNCTIVRDTKPGRSDGAYEVDHDILGRIFIPKSNIHDDSELPFAPDCDTMYVAEWFCDRKGWTKKL